jgi:hypothetical protein
MGCQLILDPLTKVEVNILHLEQTMVRLRDVRVDDDLTVVVSLELRLGKHLHDLLELLLKLLLSREK